MKRGIVLALLMGLFLSSCEAQVKNGLIDARTFEQQIKGAKAPVILDVRTPKEYAAGYIEGARLMDYYEDNFSAELKKLDREKTYFVYCAAGGRSHSVYQEMIKEGFTHVVELKDGIDGWRKQNLPVVRPK